MIFQKIYNRSYIFDKCLLNFFYFFCRGVNSADFIFLFFFYVIVNNKRERF